MVVETEAPAVQEQVTLQSREINILSFVAHKFRDQFTPEYLSGLGFIDAADLQSSIPLMYITLFYECDAQVIVEGEPIAFKALYPFDVHAFEESRKSPITLVRQLTNGMLDEEIDRLDRGEPHRMGAVNWAHALSDTSNSTIVLVEHPGKTTRRTILLTKTNQAGEFVSGLQRLQNKNLIVGAEDKNNRVHCLFVAEEEWQKSSVIRYRHKPLIDPGYSISLPLGKGCLLQIGLLNPPKGRTNGKYFNNVQELQKKAQEVLLKSWAEAEEITAVHRVETEVAYTLSPQILREALAVTRGYWELIELTLKDESTGDLIPLLKHLVRDALIAIDHQTNRVQKISHGEEIPVATQENTNHGADQMDVVDTGEFDLDKGGYGEDELGGHFIPGGMSLSPQKVEKAASVVDQTDTEDAQDDLKITKDGTVFE